ncbi:MAG: hypothetical protein GX301_05125 [Gracilibacteraceae bacterium]|nr:hypothetical protein [Gracilibacteraceae bacterium]
MTDINPSIILEDSKDNRYFFYYKDSSVCYREVPVQGDVKNTILISQSNGDFAAAIDTDDTIYLACNSRYKGVLLFIYTSSGWKFEPVVNLHNSSNIYIMDIIVQNGSIHIFFSKKLPVANMYNVYHIHKNANDKTPYIEYSWKKNSLSEIYSQSIENSYSLLPVKNGIIHYASVWYDGTHYYINYCCYDDSRKSWVHKSLSMSYRNQVFIKLLQHNKKINLLCFSNETEGSNIRHFLSKSTGSNEIDFKELGNIRIDTSGIIPLFYSDEKAIQAAWVKDHVFHQYTYDDSSGKWRKVIDLPVTVETSIHILKIMKSSNPLSITKGYFILDKNFKILRPVEYITDGISEGKPKEKVQTAPIPDMNDYLKQILVEIRELSDNVKHLNSRIGSLENKNEKNFTPEKTAIEHPILKKSGFKEKFMKSERLPNYESMLKKQENITTYVGKPVAAKPDSDIPQDSVKQAFVSPNAADQKNNEDNCAEDSGEIPYKYNSIMKKIEEFFK